MKYYSIVLSLILTLGAAYFKAANKDDAYDLTQTEQNYKINGKIKGFDKLKMKVTYETPSQLDILIKDLDDILYEIPQDEEPFKSIFHDIPNPPKYADYAYNVEVINDPLKIVVKRKETNEVIFNPHDIQFSEFYQSFKTNIPTKFFFGLGERNQVGFRFREGIYTLLARDEPKLYEDGKKPGKHVYSSQPVYLMREQSGKYHVFFYKSSSPMDVVNADNTLEFKTIGGVMNLKLFIGETAEEAVRYYHEYVGGYILHPFWASGFHQSRWTYKSAKTLINVINKYKENKIPLDTIWSDLDFMFDRQIFSVNKDLYPLSDYDIIQNTLKVHYVPLIDVAVGVKYREKDVAYSLGVQLDIFCRSPSDGSRFRGYVWPGNSYFPDFFNPKIKEFWIPMIKHLYNQTQFSGIWIDMNDPANFCNGECNWQDNRMEVNLDYVQKPLDLPYLPGHIDLATKTLPPHLKHQNGRLHKDLHNIYGLMESYFTYEGMKNLGKKLPFILSRTTFPGSNKYTFHWFGDNEASWKMLYLSIGQVFQFNIFAIPFSGADVCGFMGNTTPNLCSRWIQLGTIYPFFRNHNNDQSKNQEFYTLGPQVLKTAQLNVHLRYSLLKWYYMLFIRNQLKGTVFRPLFFVFEDEKIFEDDVLDTQIMLGSELMATPVVQQDEIIRNAYFPKGDWYDFQTGLLMQQITDQARYHLIYNPYDDYLPLFIYGGSIVLQQDTQNVLTLHDLNDQFDLVIAVDQNEESQGNALDLENYLNEEEVVDECLQNSCLLDVKFSRLDYNKYSLRISESRNKIRIKKLKIYGLLLEFKKLNCQDNSLAKVECSVQQVNYLYNMHVQFESPLKMGGKENEILLEFI